MATNLVYNGVTLGNVLTKSFRQEAVYDDSHTDLLYHKFTIKVAAYVSRIDAATVNVLPKAGATAVETETAVRTLLMEPRGDFQFSVGGKVLLEATELTDYNNGPKPRFCDVTKITGSSVLWVEFEIEVNVLTCDSPTNATGVISNRWSMDDAVDENWFTTRTIRGRLRVARNDLNPQSFRGWVMPPLQSGFRREAMHFVTSPDGLTLDYQVSDRQLFAAPPAPATTWRATHTESTGDGIASFGEVVVVLTGPPKVDKTVLIQAAAQIVQQKLGVTRNGFLGKLYVIDNVAIIDHMDRPEIEFRVRVQRSNGFDKFWNTIGDELGKPLTGSLQVEGYDQFKHPVPTAADMASPAGLFQCYLQSPCDDQHTLPHATGATSTGIDGYRSADTTVSHSTGTLPPDDYDNYSYEHKQNLYTYYRITSRYVVPQHKLQLPVASGSESTGPSAVFVRLGQSTAKRFIDVEATRVGEAPGIPAFADYTDPNLGPVHLLKHWVETEPPRVAADGRDRLYLARAHYEFGLERVPSPGQYLNTSLPWQVTQGQDLYFPASAERQLS